jgi:hypothetical protein
MGDVGAVLAFVELFLLFVELSVDLVAGVAAFEGAAGSPQAGLAGAATAGVCSIRDVDVLPFALLVSCALPLPFALVGGAEAEVVFVEAGVVGATPFFPFVPATPTDAFLSSVDSGPLLLSPAFSLGLSRQLRELLPLSFSASLSLCPSCFPFFVGAWTVSHGPSSTCTWTPVSVGVVVAETFDEPDAEADAEAVAVVVEDMDAD